MFKPTKKQHVVNKAYADSNSGGGGVLIVNGVLNGTTMTLDHTWQEIYDARAAVLVVEEEGDLTNLQLVGIGSSNDSYGCDFAGFGDNSSTYFATDSPNGYPTTTSE